MVKPQQSPGVRVVLPAKGDTSLGSVGQWFGPASICAVPDLITDVSALTSAHTMRSHRTRPMLTPPRGRRCIGRADRERKEAHQTSLEPKRRDSPEPKSPPKCS